MYNIQKLPAIVFFKQHMYMGLCVCLLSVVTAAGEENRLTPTDLIRNIEQHAENKQRVLSVLNGTPRLEITKRFGGDFRETWRRILIDSPYEGTAKRQVLETALSDFRRHGRIGKNILNWQTSTNII
jgi:hypothetical protein